MNHSRQRVAWFVAAGVISVATLAGGAFQRGEWAAYAAEHSTRYSPLDQIDKTSVKKLAIAWRQSALPLEMRGGRSNVAVTNNWENTPLMVGGLLFMSSAQGTVAALDARTGRLVWFDRATAPGGGSSRGVAYWTDGRDARVIAITGSSLTALNAATGKRYDDFGAGGQVDLGTGWDKPGAKGFHWSGTPVIVRDVIVVAGIPDGAGDLFMESQLALKNQPPGDIRGFDVRSGKHLWTFHAVPHPGEAGNETWLNDSWSMSGNSGAWGTLTGDNDLGYVYIPHETAHSDYFGGFRPGNNLFAESLVCLDAKTGTRVWHYQIVHHGLWDYDLTAAPILADITVRGTKIKAVAQTTKQAFLYVFDRTNGKPIWPIEERPVPAGDVPGEWYSPTQPIPLDAHGKPFAYDQQGVSIDDLADYTPELRQEARVILEKYNYGPIFTPPTVEGTPKSKNGTILMPGVNGGTNWQGSAFDPETGMLYVPSVHSPQFATLVKPKPAASDIPYIRKNGLPVEGLRDLPDIFKPPYGRLVAIDLNKGETRWTIANGDGPRNSPTLKGLNPPPLGQPGRVSPLVTKTLVFLGEGGNTMAFLPRGAGGKMFRAFDKKTGQIVWEMELPGGTTGSPMTYMAGGKQYIVVAVGWTDLPSELVALALP